MTGEVTTRYALTDRQAEVYSFIRLFFDKNDRLPSTRQIAKHFGWQSQTASVQVLRFLARKGWLEAAPAGGWRFSRVAWGGTILKVPSARDGGLPKLPGQPSGYQVAEVEPDDKGKSVPMSGE